MALAEWERTTDTTTAQFLEFIKFLAENNLLDEAAAHLNSKGLNKIRVSVQHIRAIQELIKDKYQNKPKASSTIMSAHVDGACK